LNGGEEWTFLLKAGRGEDYTVRGKQVIGGYSQELATLNHEL